jgi:uncharacterized membrane protein
MAGIGWRLERMMERDSLSGSLGAFLTGVAVTSGPWLLTTLVLVLVRITAAQSGTLAVQEVEQVITVVYATVIVLSAPIDIVLSRYAADRVYEKRRDQIAAPLRTIVSACLLGFTVVGAIAMMAAGFPLALALPGTVLAAIVAAQWLLLSAAGGLSSPGIIVRSFAAGAPLSVVAAYGLSRLELFGATGYLYGYGLGQLVTLALLLHGTMSALPDEEDEDASIGSSFREYWLLAAAALCFHAGLWIDKVVLYFIGDGSASIYAACAAVAWLSVVPAAAFLFVTIETTFHRRFRAYYAALHAGASLSELERLVADLRDEVEETLRGTAAVQAGVTIIAVMSAPAIVDALSLASHNSVTLAWLLVGAGLQVVAVSTTLLLYYFDFRREAFATAATQLVANGLLTLAIGGDSRALGMGYALACAVTCGVSLALLRRRMAGLLERTFQSQPFASEDAALLGHV